MSNMKSLSLRMLMYAQDHNDSLPNSSDWSDAIMPYSGNRQVYVCPKGLNKQSGYAFNKALSGKKLSGIRDPQRTVLLFESDLGWNGAGGPEALPVSPRHLHGDVFAFVDGHSAYYKREQQSSLIWQPDPGEVKRQN